MLIAFFTKTLVVFAGQTLHLHASDTLDARKLKIGINVRKGGKLIIEGTAQKPVVLLGGRGTVIRASGDISITNARFVGEMPPGCTTFAALNGNGIEVRQSVANISGTTFLNFENAVLLKGVPATRTYQTLQGNTFLQNEAGIKVNMPTGNLNLDLSCNAFEPGTSLTPNYGRTLTGNAYGINVVSGSVAKIGRFYAPTTVYFGGANYFPAANRTVPLIANWTSPSTSWKSLENAGTGILDYVYYVNEFIGNRNTSTTSVTTTTPGNTKASTDPAADPTIYDIVCSNLQDVNRVFPAGGRSGLSALPDGQAQGKVSYLMQNMPNPAQEQTLIGFQIGANYRQASLELFELTTGRVLEQRPLRIDSPRMQAFSTRSLAAGMYGYRLFVDGRQADVKKMTVTK